MGDQCGQADCEDFEGEYRRIPSLSHSSHGLVQRQTSESMEATIPSNADECNPGVSSSDRFGMGTDGRAVVEVPLRHTRIGRSEQAGMEHHSSISTTQILCEIIPKESLSVRRMLENHAIATTFMGNRHATKLLQVFQPITEFNIHSIATEKMMGMLEHCVTLIPGRGQTKEVVRMTGWNLMEEEKFLPPFDECSTPKHCLVMNIIAWKCRGF